jgi:cell division protein FtsL
MRGARAGLARFNRQRQALIILEFAVVVALLALLYLSQVAALTATHQALLQQQTQQSDLRRQDADLHAQLGRLQSPTYIEQRAHELGMVPADPASVVWVAIHDAGH